MNILLNDKVMSLLCIFLICLNQSYAQSDTWEKEIDVNILLNYYDQDGNHSAVTGGLGTEDLQDRAMDVYINVPLDSLHSFQFHNHTNIYTSASTDNIDGLVSSASKEDLRTQMELGLSKRAPERRQTYGFNIGGSVETDYTSAYLSAKWSSASKDNNRALALSLQTFFDTWLPIFPEELRDPGQAIIRTNKRRSYNLGLQLSQVINKKLQASIAGELVYQRGLLSTPFHRVYFRDTDYPTIEQLPYHRWKYPVGIRINYYMLDYFIFRFYYRFYADSFGISANTAELEMPIVISPYLTLYPLYRFHKQTAADFFRPYQQHLGDNEFYTSDYDLSAFHSHKWGLGLRLSPLFGMSRFKFLSKKRITNFKSIDLRYANYSRSDGLSSYLISTNLTFLVK